MNVCIALTDMDWSLTKDAVSMAGTIFGAGGVLVASYVGLRGLATWRKTIRGQDEHKLARQMLVELYKFEKMFARYRAPAIYPYEVQLEGDPTFVRGEHGRFNRITLGFERRIDALNTSYAEIAASLFEAKAYWDDQVLSFARKLERLRDEYEEYVRLKLLSEDPHEPEEDRYDHRNYLATRRIVFKNRLEPKDDFGNELNEVIRKLEAFLKLKLLK